MGNAQKTGVAQAQRKWGEKWKQVEEGRQDPGQTGLVCAKYS